ncbi:MAG: ATP-binding protein [Pseudomonadales bacterium]
MTLKKQLVCVSLLLLSLPWAGCQYLKEMDHSLRLGQEASLKATTEVIAQALAQTPAALLPQGDYPAPEALTAKSGFYCYPLKGSIWVDGYDEEWRDVPWTLFQSAEGLHSSKYRCVISGDQLGLFFSVDDGQVIYNNPARSLASNGDRLIVAAGAGREYVFTAVAPGSVTARYFTEQGETYRESRIDAVWMDRSKGYQLEIKMPLSLAQGQLDYRVVDEADNKISHYGPLLENGTPPRFVYQTPAARQAIMPFIQPGLRLRLLEPGGLLFASAGNPEAQGSQQSHWLLSRFYRALLVSSRQDRPAYPDGVDFSEREEVQAALAGQTGRSWYRDSQRSSHQILTMAAPVIHEGNPVAILVAEQSSEQTAGLTDQAFSRLFLLSFAVISLTALGLLAYANWLSWRIRRLNRAAQQALVDPKEVVDRYPTSFANDEIDNLTRSYSALMKRVHDYTDYLQTLARKLSHELRTPLAVIHSSLDNLTNQALDEPSRVYQQRAKDGALRLGSLITAMSESRRVEESIEQAELERVNIAALLLEITEAYRDTYQQCRFKLTGFDKKAVAAEQNVLMAAPDLLVQMLDKLVDNACSFTPPDGTVEIRFDAAADEIRIAVSNDGPLLPEAMQSQLFDNLVSVRESNGGRSHLGMGLHIVDLIVTFHQGSVVAANCPDDAGVVFTVTLPRSSGRA